ncbi:hypothetical protein Tco_1571123 [Tanacetum coccineum]
MRQRRWIELLSDYECEIKYTRGKAKFLVADALTQKEGLNTKRRKDDFEQTDDGEIYFFDRIWIPSVGGVRKLIMDEAHTSRYSVHPGADKMYYDLTEIILRCMDEVGASQLIEPELCKKKRTEKIVQIKGKIENGQEVARNAMLIEA